MVKKIGSLFVLFASSVLYAVPSIELRMVDMNGMRISHAVVSVPFKLQVTIKDTTQGDRPTIAGLDALVKGHESKQTNYRVINGKSFSETVYSYMVRADQEGMYELGPAQLEIDGKLIKSHTLPIRVVAAPSSSSQIHENTETAKPAFIELSVDRERVVAGEPVTLSVKFFHDHTAHLAEQLQINLEGWAVRAQEQLPEMTQTVQGKEYSVQEFRATLVRNDAGVFILPPVIASCLVTSQDRADNDNSFFADIFGHRRHKPFQTYSNSVRVVVERLPEQSSIQAVGSFTSATFTLDTTTAKQGEGVVARMVIEGTGDAQGVQAPRLQLPESISYYESKNDVQSLTDKSWRKTFEYILQGSEVGTFEIPAQEFEYFDTNSRRVEAITTQKTSLTIVPAQKKASGVSNGQTREVSTVDKPFLSKPDSPLDVAAAAPSARYRSAMKIAFWVLIFAFIGLMIHFLRRMMGPRIHGYITQRSVAAQQANAFKKIRRQIMQSKEKKDASPLYALLVTAFAERYQISPAQVTEVFMNQVLRPHLSENRLSEWHADFSRFAERAFFSQSAYEDVQLCDVALAWVDEFEKIL